MATPPSDFPAGLQNEFPELVDRRCRRGVFHNLVFVSIRKQYPYQAFKVMHGLWGMGQMMFSKSLSWSMKTAGTAYKRARSCFV